MWCQHCGQDVPAIAAKIGAPAGCSRCGRVSDSSHRVEAMRPKEAAVSEEWSTDRRMRRIGRSLRTPLRLASSENLDGAVHWVDAFSIVDDRIPAASTNAAAPVHRSVRGRRASELRTQWVAWFALTIGLGLATGGVVLMGMGQFGEFPEFWQWGVGVTLAGQAFLIAGLTRVLMSLWNTSRAADHRVSEMQHELAEVGRTAEAIIAQRAGGPSGFYGELARGASPTMLLANLRGQIEHLATRMHQN
jgi:hypothetical protein